MFVDEAPLWTQCLPEGGVGQGGIVATTRRYLRAAILKCLSLADPFSLIRETERRLLAFDAPNLAAGVEAQTWGHAAPPGDSGVTGQRGDAPGS